EKDVEEPTRSNDILHKLNTRNRELLNQLLVLLSVHLDSKQEMEQRGFDCRPFGGPKTPPTPNESQISYSSIQINKHSHQEMSIGSILEERRREHRRYEEIYLRTSPYTRRYKK
ncbi:unnamed protein product, partial [Hymenolepis diminuta]